MSYQVLVDGIPWENADGIDVWDTQVEAEDIAEHAEDQGYDDIEIVNIGGTPAPRRRRLR
jgi:hypothetical protein